MISPKRLIALIKIKILMNRLSRAKEDSVRDYLNLPPLRAWYIDWCHDYLESLREKCLLPLCACCIYDAAWRLRVRIGRTCCERICIHGAYENQVLKECIGFFAGLFLTMMTYLILVFQLSVAPETAFYAAGCLGLVLTLGLAFAGSFRCVVMLLFPYLFSGRGRMFLLIYAFFLVMNHPVQNFNHNIIVMSASATCGQEIAFNQTKELIAAAVSPLAGTIENVKSVIERLQQLAKNMRAVYSAMKATVSELGSTMKKAGQWLGNKVNQCNKRMGEPYQACRNAFNDAKNRCKNEVSWILHWACDIVGHIGGICHIARIGELLCLVLNFIKDLIGLSTMGPVNSSLTKVQDMFYFNVTINYEFDYKMAQTKTYNQVREDIQKEIKEYIDAFMEVIGLVRNILVFGAAFLFFKAFMYRRRFLNKDRFDNIYITFHVLDIDHRRKMQGKRSIFPLKPKEELKYVNSNSLWLVRTEIRSLLFGVFLLFISLLNAAFYLLCDVGLYSILFLIRKHFSVVSQAPVPPHTKLHVEGQGPIAEMYRAMVAMFDPLAESNVKLQLGPCIPDPSPPNLAVYRQIGLIYFICLMLTIAQPYGMRLRHMIMGWLHPARERRRGFWLYNHIVKLRTTVKETAKKSMKSKFTSEKTHTSIKGRLAARYPLLERLFKCCGWKRKLCLWCGREGLPDDRINFIHCLNPECKAVYCVECYADMDNTCSICTNKLELGGSSASEEVDSSIAEAELARSRRDKAQRDAKIRRLKLERGGSRVMARFRDRIQFTEKKTPENQPRVNESSDDSDTEESQNEPPHDDGEKMDEGSRVTEGSHSDSSSATGAVQDASSPTRNRGDFSSNNPHFRQTCRREMRRHLGDGLYQTIRQQDTRLKEYLLKARTRRRQSGNVVDPASDSESDASSIDDLSDSDFIYQYEPKQCDSSTSEDNEDDIFNSGRRRRKRLTKRRVEKASVAEGRDGVSCSGSSGWNGDCDSDTTTLTIAIDAT